MAAINSLQNLVNSVNGIQQRIEAASLSVSFHSKSYDPKSSEFHFKFDKLMNKFSGFAEEYRFELDQFHKLLLNNITTLLKQAKEKNERELAVIMGKLETISNSNNEIVDNLAEIDNNSPAASIKMQNDSSYSVTIRTPTPVPAVHNNNNNNDNNTTSRKTTNRTARKTANTNKPKTVKKVSKIKSIANNNSVKEYMDEPYSYNPDTAAWIFRGVAKSSTRIFVGNLPNDMTKKRLQIWIRNRAHVGPTQIDETQIRNGARSKYALVRFSNDVSMHKATKFMNKINKENDDIYQKRKEEKGSKKNDVISWKKQVFLRFHRGFQVYDNDADCTLFIRNFDILDEKCHAELTQTLIKYGGDLVRDIKISLDSYQDPFCTVSFKDIDGAMYCCNSEIDFNGRILEMRYSRK